MVGIVISRQTQSLLKNVWSEQLPIHAVLSNSLMHSSALAKWLSSSFS